MASREHVDVVVVGAGPGGTPAAMSLAQGGKRVLLVEGGRGLGGTCLFEGCIPSKIFRETAARRREMARAGEFGLHGMAQGDPAINWSQVQTRRHHILNQRAQGALAKARALPGLETVFARARLTGPRSMVLEVQGSLRAVQFEQAILATGSVPNRLPIPGAELPGVIDSKGLVEVGFVPESLVLVGGGPIGVEMAQIFAMLGAEVTILEAMPRILGPVDSTLANLLGERLGEDGIAVHTGVEVSAIEGAGLQHTVHYMHNGHTRQVSAQLVAMVAGRHPNVAGLGLETTAVRFDKHGLKVDERLESDEAGIFATGDLVGQPMFAHWATAQAHAVANHLLGRDSRYPRPEHNSAVIFSYPELGMAGLTEEGAHAAGMDVAVAEYDYGMDARAQIGASAFGRLRIIYAREDRRIVGVHALVEGAADLMGEASLAVRHGLRLDQLREAIHPHPTLTEAFGLACPLRE